MFTFDVLIFFRLNDKNLRDSNSDFIHPIGKGLAFEILIVGKRIQNGSELSRLDDRAGAFVANNVVRSGDEFDRMDITGIGWTLRNGSGKCNPNGDWVRFSSFVENDPAFRICLLYTSPSPRDRTRSRMPSSA